MNRERCRHCQHVIAYDPAIGVWVHDTGSVYCDLAGQDCAEPSRWGG